jgi:hypothetical protein
MQFIVLFLKANIRCMKLAGKNDVMHPGDAIRNRRVHGISAVLNNSWWLKGGKADSGFDLRSAASVVAVHKQGGMTSYNGGDGLGVSE